MPPAAFGYNPLQVLGYGVREGDSIITSQIVDTMVSRHVFPALKSWMHPGAEWTTRIKILRVFRPGQETDNLLREDKLREKRRTDSVQTILGPLRVARMISQKHIVAEPAGDGVFVERLAKGEGPVADSGRILQLRYSILSLDGTHLDSNADTAAAKAPLFQYVSGTQFMLPVADKVLRTLRQGDHVRIYLPAMQALGDRPFGTSGKPYEDLIFDVELVRVEPGKLPCAG
jgi:FKBP-type peptidyl-prolyl cis-trans isomerase